MAKKQGGGKIEVERERCTGCGLCIPECSVEVIDYAKEINSEGYHVVNQVKDGCTACRLCAIVCPHIAITVYRYGKEDGNRKT